MNWLRSFFDLGITANEATISGHRTPMGYIQYTPTGTATKLGSVAGFPAGFAGFVPAYAIIQCVGAAGTDYAAWRDDVGLPSATSPTMDATHSMRLFSGQELDYAGDISNIQFMIGSGTPVLNISLYA